MTGYAEEVAGGYDGRVLVWDPAEPGIPPVELGLHENWVEAVAVLPVVPDSVISGTAAADDAVPGQPVPETSPGTACRTAGTGTVSGTMAP